MSAWRTIAGKSAVRLWAMVTVQLSPSRSSAIGLPTMFERPMTTALLPGKVAKLGAEQFEAAERGAGHEPLEPVASRPALIGWKPSTSLSGSMRVMTLARVDVARQRQLDEDAVDRGIGVEPVDQREQVGLAGVGGSRCSKLSIPASRVALPLART